MATVTLATLQNMRKELVNSRYYLNIRSGYMAPVTLHCSYGDSGETITFYIFDGGDELDLTGSTVSVHGTRRDGANFGPYSCTVSGNSVSFQLQSAMTAVEGGGIAEFTISKSESTIGTANFGIMVEDAVFPNGVSYDSDPSVYQDILRYVQGQSAELMLDYNSKIAEEVNARISADNANTDAISVERARIDNYLTSGTAATDSELIDIRVKFDGTTADSAGNAVREQISSLEDRFSDIFDTDTSPNVFNGVFHSGYMNLSGGITASTDYSYTDRIPVTKTTFIAIGSNIVNSRRQNVQLRFVTAFDASGNALSSYGLQNAGNDNYVDTNGATVITLNSAVKFIVLSIYKPDSKYSNISVSFDTASIDYFPYGDSYEIKLESLPEAISSIISPNVFNGTFHTGYMNMDGGVSTSTTDYSYTDKIAVTGVSFIVTGDNIVNGRRQNCNIRFVTAFDADKNVLSSYGQQNVGSQTYIDTDGANVITLNAAVKYIVITIYKPAALYTNISISFDVNTTDYVPFGLNVSGGTNSKKDVIHSYLRGKTVAVFGDSLMYGAGSSGKGPADILAEKYDMSINKYCVSGSTMGVRTDDETYTVDEVHHIAKQVRNAIAAGITPSIIIFNGGTNDIGGSIPKGSITTVYTQPASESYFADGFETVAYLLNKNFVGIPMVYIRAHNMSSRTYAGQIEYGELGVQIAEKWGIYVIDMYKRMNTQLEEYRTAYLEDYTHPNLAGYTKYYIPAIEEFIYNKLI